MGHQWMREKVSVRLVFICFQGSIEDGLEIRLRGSGERCLRPETWQQQRGAKTQTPNSPPRQTIPNPHTDNNHHTQASCHTIDAWHRTMLALEAEGVAFAEETLHQRAAVVDGIMYAYVLHRVLYPQVHENGVKIKKQRGAMSECMILTERVRSPESLAPRVPETPARPRRLTSI